MTLNSAAQLQNKEESVENTSAAKPLDALSTLLKDDMAQVNEVILRSMQSDVPMIPQLAGYLIAAGGKRLRPLLTLAAAKIFDENARPAHGLAAAVEFIHTATLLHDDVVDGSEERRGQKAANLIFGNQSAVLVGDFLFSRAFELMVESDNIRVLGILSKASAVIAEGEVLQLAAQGQIDTSWETYLKVIEAKTAALFAAACEVGPVIQGATAQHAEALRLYGLYLGLAFQIADDLLDYTGTLDTLGKNPGDDFLDGKLTAPVLLALQHADADEKEFWARIFTERNVEDGDLEHAQKLFAKHGSLDKAQEIALSYAQKAVDALEGLPPSPITPILQKIPHYAVTRST
ncbi:MAG: polyprenyl synthetase family protein [Pseudobdellovibrionaceae bacterium]